MKIASIAIALTLIAGQAAALSCVPPDPVRIFERLAASDDTYYVLYGTLDFVSPAPKKDAKLGTAPANVIGRFEGSSLTAAGFTRTFQSAVTLTASCAGPWCGGHVANVESIMFAKVTGETITIEAGPCGSTVFLNTTARDRSNLAACMAGNCP